MIYVIGGYISSEFPFTYTNKMDAYNWKLNTWDTTLAPVPFQTNCGGVSGAVVEAVNGKIYVIGGLCGFTSTNEAFVYDPEKNEWSAIANLPSQRGSSGSSVFDDRIYIFGGAQFIMAPILDEVIMYNPETNGWNAEPPLADARRGPSAETLRDKIYVIGGSNEMMEIFLPATRRWDPAVLMPGRKVGHGSAASTYQDKLYVFGGTSTDDLPSPGMWSYAPLTGTWKNEQAILPKPISNFATTLVQSSDCPECICQECIYVFGGAYEYMGEIPLVSDKVYRYCLYTKPEITGGPVSGTWTAACSPYKISGDIFVPNGQTLTIEPGTDVVFTGHYQFNVHGRLLAVGTQDSMITFSAENREAGWNGLRFIDVGGNNDTSRVVYCRIQDGFPTGPMPLDGCGGGIYIQSTDKLLVANCEISFNRTLAPLPSENVGGAGIAMIHSSPIIVSNLIMHNTAGGGPGGGLAIFYDSKPVINNNIVTRNQAFLGGGIHAAGSSPILFNNTIVLNEAGAGGGIQIADSSGTLLVNTILYNNEGHGLGDEVHLIGTHQVDFYHCDIAGGVEGFAQDFSAGAPDYSGTFIGNIDADPEFVDLDSFALAATSPCISVGVDGVSLAGQWYPAPAMDFLGMPRPQPAGSAPDIGAIENENGFPVSLLPSPSESGLRILDIAPNPGHDQVTLTYHLPTAGEVVIHLHDASGKLLETRMEGRLREGDHTCLWNVHALAPGLYYLSLRENNLLQTGKLVIY